MGAGLPFFQILPLFVELPCNGQTNWITSKGLQLHHHFTCRHTCRTRVVTIQVTHPLHENCRTRLFRYNLLPYISMCGSAVSCHIPSNTPSPTQMMGILLADWLIRLGSARMGHDGFNRILPFRPCQGTACTPHNM